MSEVHEVVLDASALLALLNDEPGAAAVAARCEGAAISTVNLAEVVSTLLERGLPRSLIEAVLSRLPIEVAPFTTPQAWTAGRLRADTRKAGLSLGDRACLALAGELGRPALTADRRWKDLAVGVTVELVR